MLTRCPACETHFRVTAEQLKARSGRVRCGECQFVFNALDSLIEEPMVAASVAPAMPAQVITPLAPDAEPATIACPESIDDEVASPQAPAPGVPSRIIDLDREPASQAQQDLSASLPHELEGPPIPEPIDATASGTGEFATNPLEVVESIAIEAEAPNWSETFPVPPPPSRRWPWVLGSLVALTAIGLQAALAFRVELAILWPEVKPALVTLCDIAGCEVGLPAKVALVSIEASDLHPDNEHAGRLVLTATLKNRAPFAQQFPHLELTLTDTADKAIARRVLAPKDYLPPRISVTAGMQSGADTILSVGVDPGEMAASGYRLYLFYP